MVFGQAAIGATGTRHVHHTAHLGGSNKLYVEPVRHGIVGRSAPFAVPEAGLVTIDGSRSRTVGSGLAGRLLGAGCSGHALGKVVVCRLKLEALNCLGERLRVGINRILHAHRQVALDAIARRRECRNGLVGIDRQVGRNCGEQGVELAVIGRLVLDVGNAVVDLLREIGNLGGIGVDLVDKSASPLNELLELGIVRTGSEHGAGLELGIIERHGGRKRSVTRQTNIIDVTREGIRLAADAFDREHAGGLELIVAIPTDGLLELAIHIERNLAHALVLELKLNPLVHGKRVVEGVVMVLAGNTDLTGLCLNGLDGAIGALEQNLILVARGIGALDLHAQIVTKTGGLKIGIQRDIALAALELERLLKVDVDDLGVLGRLQVEAVAVARGIVGIVHTKLHDGTLGIGRGLVAKVGIGGVAELLGSSLCSGDIGCALAPGGSSIQASGVGDAVVDIVLGDAIFLLAAHVVPNGKGTTDHLLVAGGNRNVVVVVNRRVIDSVVVEVIEVITGVGDDVIPAVDAVDQVKAEVVHLVHLGPACAPEVHLAVLAGSTLTLNVNGTFDPGEAAPHASGAARILHVLKEVVDEIAICVAVGLVLVSANMNHGLVVKDRVGTGEVLVPDGKREGQGLIVLSGQVKVVITATRHRLGRAQVGANVGERQGVRRHIELGNDIDAKVARMLNKLTEIGLGVPHIGARQVGLVLTVVAALLDVGLQAEAVIGSVYGVVRIFLDPNIVVGKVDLEVVELKPGQLLAHLLEPVEREGLTAHVENQAAHLVERVVAGDSLRDGAVAGLESLQDGTGGPVGTGLGLGLDAHGVGDLHEVTLVLKTERLVAGLGQEDVAGVGGATLNDRQLGAKQVLVIGGQLVSSRLKVVAVVDNARLSARSKGAGAALPLAKLRQNLGGGVIARLDLELTRNGNGNLFERIGVLVALLGHLEGDLDLRINDRLVDGNRAVVGLSANNLLVIGTVVGDVIFVRCRQGHLELSVALLGGLDLDGIGQAVHVHLGRAAKDLELINGNVAPCDTAVGVGIGVVVDVQTDKASPMHLIEGDQVDLARRMSVIGVNRLPVGAIGGRGAIAVGNLDLVSLSLAHLPEHADAFDIALLAQIDVDPVRATIPRSGSVNGTCPTG